jgi:MFS transporter, PPP family, 3-phenylpropionic acid transporter
MDESYKKNSIIISCFFLSYFIAVGAFMPLFSLYLQELDFTGTQIGIIASIHPLIMLLIQPLWGYLADTTGRLHIILVTTILIASGIGIVFPFVDGFSIFILLSFLFAFFNSAAEPISTSIIMTYTEKNNQHYADYRLWGAVGFALSAWVLSQLSQFNSLKIIFYTLSLFLFLSIFYAWKLPIEPSLLKSKVRKGNVKKLITNKPFLLFLFACFLVYGVMLANNSFFGILYTSLGGTLAGVGVSFLISVGSEVPFMRLAGKLLKKIETTSILVFASFISGLQYFCFFFHPTELWIYFLNVAQGFSLGIFIPVSVAYVQKYTSKTIQTTAIGIFNGISFGLGNWFFTLAGGIVLDYKSIHYVYLLFSIVSFLGMFFLMALRQISRKPIPLHIHES